MEKRDYEKELWDCLKYYIIWDYIPWCEDEYTKKELIEELCLIGTKIAYILKDMYEYKVYSNDIYKYHYLTLKNAEDILFYKNFNKAIYCIDIPKEKVVLGDTYPALVFVIREELG